MNSIFSKIVSGSCLTCKKKLNSVEIYLEDNPYNISASKCKLCLDIIINNIKIYNTTYAEHYLYYLINKSNMSIIDIDFKKIIYICYCGGRFKHTTLYTHILSKKHINVGKILPTKLRPPRPPRQPRPPRPPKTNNKTPDSQLRAITRYYNKNKLLCNQRTKQWRINNADYHREYSKLYMRTYRQYKYT